MGVPGEAAGESPAEHGVTGSDAYKAYTISARRAPFNRHPLAPARIGEDGVVVLDHGHHDDSDAGVRCRRWPRRTSTPPMPGMGRFISTRVPGDRAVFTATSRTMVLYLDAPMGANLEMSDEVGTE
ncbi:MAG: hypothetical protein ABI083_12805 [Lapillicoccus sp.]